MSFANFHLRVKRCGLAALLSLMTVAMLALSNVSASETEKPTQNQRAAVAGSPLGENVRPALDLLVRHALDQAAWDPANTAPFETIAESRDPRLTWALVDMMKFTWRPEFFEQLKLVAAQLTGWKPKGLQQRQDLADHLITLDVPAYPGYLEQKRAIYTHYVEGWNRLFVPGDVDWRLVEWGGVNADHRPFDQTDEICHCIPAIDNPTTQPAADATWLTPDAIVFGIEINGEARAYPLRIMEVRELVNDTLGGRDLAMPYCSLCGAAQAFFTDRLPAGVKRPVMRTSGLLLRSNKIMFDVETYSLFETFFGRAVTGPLAQKKLTLSPIPVIATTWASWRATHPKTTVLTEDLALGRNYDLRNSRDAGGAIFPIGDVDPRLSSHEDVLGVVAPNGQAYAFHSGAAIAALKSGQVPRLGDLHLKLVGGGLQAELSDGTALASHPSYWFAWSQFHPTTRVWPATSN